MATSFFGTKDLGEKDKERGKGRDGQREAGKKGGREREEDVDDKRGRTRGAGRRECKGGLSSGAPSTHKVSQTPPPALLPYFTVKL